MDTREGGAPGHSTFLTGKKIPYADGGNHSDEQHGIEWMGVLYRETESEIPLALIGFDPDHSLTAAGY